MRPRNLLHLSRYRPRALAAALVLWIAYSCAPLAAGLAMKRLFDAVADTASADARVWTILAVFAAIELASAPLSVVWMYAHLGFENLLELLVRRNLFHGAISQRSASIGVGDGIARFRDDVDGAITPINEWYRLIGEGLFTAAAVVVMLRTDILITLVALLPTAAAVVLLNRARARLHRYTLATRHAASAVSGFLGDVLHAVLATKAAGAEDRVVAELNRLGDDRRRAALRSSVLNELLTSASGNVSLVARAIVLLLATVSLRSGEFTVGDFALFALYMEWVFELPRRIGRALASHRVSAVSTERLTEMIGDPDQRALVEHHSLEPIPHDAEPDQLVKHPADPLNVLTVRGLTSRHRGSGRGIEDVSFRVDRGSFVVITGRVGAGKTTLVRALLGLKDRDAGEVTWNGEDASHLGPPRVAYVAQAPVLFTQSLRDNLLLGLRPYPDELESAVRRTALSADVAAMEAGLDTIVGPRGARLSGGQILRAATARALLRQPELLVLDDVSSALDVGTEQDLWTGLREDRHLSILAVSTRRHTLRHADHIIVLDEGRVIGNGVLDDLLADCPVLAEIWTHG